MPTPASHLEVVRCTPGDLTPPVLDAAAALLQDLVRQGAALGWVDPHATAEVSALLHEVGSDVEDGDAALALAWSGNELAGLGCWRR